MPQRLLEFFAQVDWRLALMLGPRHQFSPAQWARMSGQSGISPSVKVAALLNALMLAAALSYGLPGGLALPAGLGLLLLNLLMLRAAAAIWRRPTMQRLYAAYGLVFVLGLAAGIALAWLRHDPARRALLEPIIWRGAIQGVLFAFGIWVVAMWRNEHLADWLNDQALHERALELSRRLSSAQIQPHFLFNSLASLQHWVATRDERAAPLLASLTGYLRATLPLFDRPLLSLAEEAEAVRRYLEVMRARLGERLAFDMDLAPEAAAAQLPPGLLLTLVENAIEHGVTPKLGPARVRVSAACEGAAVRVEVADDGPGLAAPPHQAAGPGRGVGLVNSRLRLAQAFGERALLILENAPAGGCIARLRLPAATPTTTAEERHR